MHFSVADNSRFEARAPPISRTLHRRFLALSSPAVIVERMQRFRARPVVIGAVAAIVVLAAVILVISHSDDAHPAADPTQVATSSGTSSGSTRAAPGTTALWHDVAQCLRNHGSALADPTVSATGVPTWTDGNAGAVRFKNAMRAVGFKFCKSQLDALPAQATDPPPTPAELHNLVRFAQCMRSHGISDWPDPHADGTFPIPARVQALGKLGIMIQLRACRQYTGGHGIAVSPGSAPSKGGKASG
jgi:hypothetical protein